MNMQSPLPLEQMPRSLEGKVSLVTGSTSGIGLGIARALAAAGSAVVLNGFGKPEDVAEAQARVISEFGVEVRYSPADMSKAQAITDLIAMTLDNFGRLDILVNNAGIQHVAPLEEFPAEKWDAILAINLSSAFHTTRAALPSMRKNDFGRIINIASAHGLVASPFKAAYVAAKHGIARPHQGDGAGNRRSQHHLQRDLPGLCLYAAGRGADRRPGQGARHPARTGDPRRAARAAAQQALRDRRGTGRACRCFLRAMRLPRSPALRLPVDGGWTAH